MADEIWDRVVQGRWHVLCMTCFDEVAQEMRVPYHVDAALYPCSWDDWV